jgi:group II intron reverse transcriptase/maturase
VPGYGVVVGEHTLHKEVRMDVYTKRQRIAEIAKHHREEPITLLHHYIDEEWLTVAYHLLPKDKATGVDQQSWEEYGEKLEENIRSLLNRAKSGSYKAPPVRRAMIPKPGSKEKRKLGIPTTEDKVLQKAVLMLLEPIYELEFYEFSFGFRRGKSQHQGLEYLWKGIMDNNIQWIIDLDIRKFFDTVKHEILRRLLRIRVRDGVITRLIGKWLKAGVLEEGSISYSYEGTPQGGVVKPTLQGRSIIIRFADDVVMGFESKAEAEEALEALKNRLGEFGLELHPEKTRLIYFGKPKGEVRRGNGTRPGTFDFRFEEETERDRARLTFWDLPITGASPLRVTG